MFSLESNCHPMPLSAATSMESPANVRPSETIPWQADSTKELSTDASRTLPFDHEPARFTTPAKTNSSIIKAPDLSKRQRVTLPAISTRKGSVENTPAEWRDMSAAFTASIM